jgi:hypothetical protein
MEFDDPRWSGLLGGYRVPYDPRKALLALERGGETDGIWEELWNELHHQGDVGEASYAAVPHLVRIHAARGQANWNTYALVATIEDARRNGRRNPELPPDLRNAYEAAWGDLVGIGLREMETAQDPTLIVSIIGVIAYGKGQATLGRLAVAFTDDERLDMLRAAEWA